MSVDFGLFLRQGFKEEGRRGEQGAGGEKNGWGGGGGGGGGRKEVLTKPSPEYQHLSVFSSKRGRTTLPLHSLIGPKKNNIYFAS